MFDENIKEVFPSAFSLEQQSSSANDSNYVLHLTRSADKQFLGAAFSNNSVSFYNADNLGKVRTVENAHGDAITGMRFYHRDPNLCLTSSTDRCLKLWDLRDSDSRKPCQVFKSETPGYEGKPLNSFDLNCNDTFVCAGTEQVKTDTFLLFWDTRNPNNLQVGAFCCQRITTSQTTLWTFGNSYFDWKKSLEFENIISMAFVNSKAAPNWLNSTKTQTYIDLSTIFSVFKRT